jgi:hypothetical protein
MVCTTRTELVLATKPPEWDSIENPSGNISMGIPQKDEAGGGTSSSIDEMETW